MPRRSSICYHRIKSSTLSTSAGSSSKQRCVACIYIHFTIGIPTRLLIFACLLLSTSQIEDVLQLCIPALGTAIPPFRFPRFMYRTEGCFGFFEGKFKHLLDSEELEAHLFHCLREIGNGLSFLLLLSDIMVCLQHNLWIPAIVTDAFICFQC